ncbi:MAG: Holliday junction branch migration protein RuvA [Betaproteobacteria bacterium]|jgi:Holliday junction DNA helicase RuvA|nr:Holliday junction branch migration protein RuvA [Betaproteobacteria bacterium]
MIGRLSGLLLEKSPPTVLVDVGGVGYEVDVPMSSFYDLPEIGTRVVLLTEFIVREDAQLLYGFLTAPERDTFRQLIRISGVGPRTALAVLSGMSVADLTQAVALQESARLLKVPGIGKKTAERLLLELKGKLAPALPHAPGTAVTVDAGVDIVRALIALGYSEREAQAALRGLPPDVSVSDGIRQALRQLGKN